MSSVQNKDRVSDKANAKYATLETTHVAGFHPSPRINTMQSASTIDSQDYFVKLENLTRTAKLANLILSEKEKELFIEQLSKILEYIEQLNNVNTDDIESTFNVSTQSNVLAKDEIGDCTISQDEALQNAQEKRDGFFVTKGVFDNE